jgi:ABC-type uncharacterized transport system, permease component
METNYIFLTNGQLLIASFLMAVNIGLSLILKLGLAKQWSIASLRMVGQLLLVGFLLDWVFCAQQPFFGFLELHCSWQQSLPLLQLDVHENDFPQFI